MKLSEPKSVRQVKLMEGRFGSGSRVQDYCIEALDRGEWKTIHAGTTIGGECNILLSEPANSVTLRLHVLQGTDTWT